MDKAKKKYIFLVTISIIGIVVGIIFSNILSTADEKLVYDKLTNYFLNIKEGNSINYLETFLNSIKNNGITLVLIWTFGLSIIGLIFNVFILFFKNFILGFSIGSIINIYLYRGILLSLIYIFPHEIFNIIILLLLIYYANNCSINLFRMLFLKKEIKFNEIMKRYFKIFGLCLGGFLISSLVETFFSPFFIKIFTFLVN